MKSPFHKIGYKLIFAVGVTAIIIIGIFAYFNIQSHSNDLFKQAELHVNQLSETVKYSTKYDMLYNQREHIHETIFTIGEQSDINSVRIINKLGEIIYSSNKDDIGKMVDKEAESCYACHAADKPLESLPIKDRTRIYKLHPDSSRLMGIIDPIYNEASCWNAACHAHQKSQKILGVLDVTIPLSRIDARIASSELEIVIFSIIAVLAVSFIIGFFVKRWIDKPVNELLTATQHVGSGNLNYTIQYKKDDEIGSLAKSFNNMTQKLSEARLQLFQSDKMASLGRLAAGVAHEINNPLTGVLTYSSFLLKKTNDPEMQEDLKVIVRETKRSREIVKSLLDFARQSVPKKNIADINEIIERAITVIENQLTIKKIELAKNFDESLPKLTLDANQMQQVFINLIVNASDAIDNPNGKVKISTKFIKLSPYGIIHIKKAVCPKRHDLMDNEIKIDGMPSIKLKTYSSGKEGIIHLDPVYGKHRDHFNGAEINDDTQILCPECNYSLMVPNKQCPVCNSPVFTFEIPSQGMYESCVSKECQWEKWEAIDLQGQKDYVEIKIEDNGGGISKEDLSKIFEPFFSTKGQKGTGLGLAVIWGIVDNHDGTIEVTSELKKGTSFTIRLPIKSI